MKREVWKPIKGYDNYLVSNQGRVKNNKSGNIIKDYNDKKGYRKIKLSKNGIPKNYSVHRLVANAFIPNPKNLPQVNHKDENKMNNNVNNLEWCDAKYNNNYGTRTKRQIETRKKNRKILSINLNIYL